jgi:hypothetical protein
MSKWRDLCAARYSISRERAFDKQSSSKFMCDKTQSISNKCFSAAIKMWQLEIDCDEAGLDQKTKPANSTCYFSISLLYCYLNFVHFMLNVVYCVLYFLTYQLLLLWLLQDINANIPPVALYFNIKHSIDLGVFLAPILLI